MRMINSCMLSIPAIVLFLPTCARLIVGVVE